MLNGLLSLGLPMLIHNPRIYNRTMEFVLSDHDQCAVRLATCGIEADQ